MLLILKQMSPTITYFLLELPIQKQTPFSYDYKYSSLLHHLALFSSKHKYLSKITTVIYYLVLLVFKPFLVDYKFLRVPSLWNQSYLFPVYYIPPNAWTLKELITIDVPYVFLKICIRSYIY